MLFLGSQTKRKLDKQTVLQRIAQSDKTAIQDCLTAYGDLVWTLVRAKISSAEEAERLTAEIFSDVWKYADRFDSAKGSEISFISRLAQRRLILH